VSVAEGSGRGGVGPGVLGELRLVHRRVGPACSQARLLPLTGDPDALGDLGRPLPRIPRQLGGRRLLDGQRQIETIGERAR
jgi:hypothetical protein